MQAPKPEPQGAAEWIGTIAGLLLAIPVAVGIIILVTLPFALPFVSMAVFLDGDPLWQAAVFGLLVVLGCAVMLWAIDAVVKFADRRECARAVGQQHHAGPLQRVVGLMVDHPRVSYWSAVTLMLTGGAIVFGISWSAAIAGILLLWGVLQRLWRRIRPMNEVEDGRLAHIRALKAQGDAAAVGLLGQYVHDPMQSVSRRSVSALADIGSPEARDELRRAVANRGTEPVTRWARFVLWIVDHGARA